MSKGNVFVFSFSREGFEAIVNLTELDQKYLLAKMGGDTLPQSVGSIIDMMKIRAQFNQNRGMEVWLVKLSEEFTEEYLNAWAARDPQEVANIARMGENVYGDARRHPRAVIT